MLQASAELKHIVFARAHTEAGDTMRHPTLGPLSAPPLSILGLTAALVCLSPAISRASPSVHDEAAYTESGEASWYGPRHEGKRTTSGEVFDSGKLTAAHPSLPMGSYVRVTVQTTGRSVVVKVNDREPPHGVRCIDLSREAARRLGIIQRGLADVTLAQVDASEATEVAEAPETATSVKSGVSAPRGRRHRHHAHQ